MKQAQPSVRWLGMALVAARLAVALAALAIAAQASAALMAAPAAAFAGVDWKTLSVPGAACSTAQSVRLVEGSATAASRHWPGVSRVALSVATETYGELGAGRSVAAVDVWCSSPGGMADDELANVWLVYTSAAGHLHLVGVISVRAPAPTPGVHVSLIGAVSFHADSITAAESWYKPSDPTCCPSGRATSTWSYANGALSYSGTTIAR
jgi:hypothetical protein